MEDHEVNKLVWQNIHLKPMTDCFHLCLFGYELDPKHVLASDLSDDQVLRKLRDGLRAVLDTYHKKLIECGIGDPPRGRYSSSEDIRDSLYGHMTNRKSAHTNLSDIWRLVKYLEARIALLSGEQGVNEIWQEAYRAGCNVGYRKGQEDAKKGVDTVDYSED